MFDPLRFLSPAYLFDVNPGSTFPGYWILLLFFGLLLLVAIFILIYLRVRKVYPPLKKILRPLPTRLEVFALVGIFLVLFRLSAAYYLSMRFWLLVWFIIFIWFLISLSQKIRAYPEALRAYLSKEENQKYVHTSKKKRR